MSMLYRMDWGNQVISLVQAMVVRILKLNF